MGTSVGKRQREREKVEKAQAKAERRATRKAVEVDPIGPVVHRSESELIEDLGALHRQLEAGSLSPEDFDDRRERLQVQFEQISK